MSAAKSRDDVGSLRKKINELTAERKQYRLMDKRLEKALREWRITLDAVKDMIILMDADCVLLRANRATASYLKTDIREIPGKNCRDIFSGTEKSSVLDLFEKMKQTGKHEEAEVYLVEKDRWILVSLDPILDENDKLTGAVLYIKDVTEHKQAERKLTQSLERLKRLMKETVGTIALIGEMRDPYTAGHEKRVAQLAVLIAEELRLPAELVEGIQITGYLHDIGKIAVPAEILTKPNRLSDLEISIIRTHSQAGYNILKQLQFPWTVADFVLQHHERLDGSGYPQGLKGDRILPEARIIAVADVVEAMSSHRPYRPSLGIEKALDEIRQNRNILYDAAAVDACLKVFEEGRFAFVWEESGGLWSPVNL